MTLYSFAWHTENQSEYVMLSSMLGRLFDMPWNFLPPPLIGVSGMFGGGSCMACPLLNSNPSHSSLQPLPPSLYPHLLFIPAPPTLHSNPSHLHCSTPTLHSSPSRSSLQPLPLLTPAHPTLHSSPSHSSLLPIPLFIPAPPTLHLCQRW